jgi:hypothetical protein
MGVAVQVMQAAEQYLARNFDADLRDYEQKKRVAATKLEAWQQVVKKSIRDGAPTPPMPADAQEPAAPVRPRIAVADATVERLGTLSASQLRGLIQTRDELAGYFGSFGRYSGSGSGDRAFALEMYGGRQYTIDRVKHSQPIVVQHLSVGLLGGIQPDRLEELLKCPDDGLISRMLWSYPDALPDFKLCRTKQDNQKAREAFLRLAELPMAADEHGRLVPKRIRLSPAAECVLESFAKRLGREAHASHGLIAGAFGKARGHALRLATVLEHLWWSAAGGPEPKQITEAAVRAAVAMLDDYYHPMAQRVFGIAARCAADRRAMVLAQHIHKHGLTRFNARSLRREIGAAVGTEAAEMDKACAVLIDAGWIRPSGYSGKGRPASNYEVNPAVLSHAS